MVQAQEMSSRDPAAATLLVANLIASEKEAEQKGEQPTGYDPIELYAFMCKEYAWRPIDIDSMHYPTFFALVRKTKKRIDKEREQMRQTLSK